MKRKHDEIPELIAETRAAQRNTVWPDTLRNGRSVDWLLWKGSPTAKPVQRIGILILAISFFLMGVTFYSMALDQHSFTPFIGTLFTFAAGTKLTLSAARGLGTGRSPRKS